MSTRDYRLTVRLDIDKQSVNEFANRLSEALQKSLNRALKGLEKVGVIGKGASKVVIDESFVRALNRLDATMTKMNITMAALMTKIDKLKVPRRPKKKEVRKEKKEYTFEDFIRAVRESTAPMARAVVLGMAIYDIIKRIVEHASQFAGYFRASMKLLETIIALFLRPILDVIGLLLRPFLLLMLPVAVALNKHLGPILAKAAQGEYAPLIVAGIGGIIGAFGGRMVGQLIGQILGQAIGRILGSAAAGAALGSVGGPVGMAVGLFAGAVGGLVLGDIFADWINKVLKGEAGKSISDALGGIGKWFSDTFAGIADTIGRAWDGFVKWISDNLGGIGEMIGGAWSTFVRWFSDNIGKVGEFIGDAWNRFIDWISGNLGAVGDLLGKAWDGFTAWISDNLGNIGSLVGGAWNSFTSWILDNLGKIGDKLGRAWDSFIDWVKNNLGNIGDSLGRAWGNFVNWVKDNFGRIGELIGGWWNEFVRFMYGVGRAIQDTLGPVWEKIESFFSTVGDIIGRLLRGDIGGLLGGIFGGRGQFGLDVRVPGPYFLEAGEIVLNRADVMRLVAMLAGEGRANNVSVVVNVSGPIYGVSDLEDRIKRVVESSVGNILYDMARRGVR